MQTVNKALRFFGFAPVDDPLQLVLSAYDYRHVKYDCDASSSITDEQMALASRISELCTITVTNDTTQWSTSIFLSITRIFNALFLLGSLIGSLAYRDYSSSVDKWPFYFTHLTVLGVFLYFLVIEIVL